MKRSQVDQMKNYKCYINITKPYVTCLFEYSIQNCTANYTMVGYCNFGGIMKSYADKPIHVYSVFKPVIYTFFTSQKVRYPDELIAHEIYFVQAGVLKRLF